MRTCTNYSQYVVSDTNKDFKFDLDRKVKSWLKFEPKFLTWLPNSKLEKTTVYLLFSLFIQFSAIEIRSSLFSLKACDKFFTMTGKKGGLPMVVGELQPFFQLTELKLKVNSPCFQYAHARGQAKWRHKLCAERMHDANVRNHLKLARSLMINFVSLLSLMVS